MDSAPEQPATALIRVPRVQRVSVICWDASFRERFDALECLARQTLPRARFEVIFVEYYRDVNPAVRDYAARCENMRILSVGHEHPGRENQHRIGVCVNEGLRHARGDLIVVPDADVRFEEDFLEEVIRQHEAHEELALYFYRLDEPPGAPPAVPVPRRLANLCEVTNPGNYGGCLSVRRRWLEAINGYEESSLFTGYSGVDVDTASRLRALGLAIKWHPDRLLRHTHHPGTAAPDAESLARLRWQFEWTMERMRTRQTLPRYGLDPGVKSDWTSQKPELNRGEWTRQAERVRRARRLTHLIVPGRVRTWLVRTLRD